MAAIIKTGQVSGPSCWGVIFVGLVEINLTIGRCQLVLMRLLFMMKVGSRATAAAPAHRARQGK